MCKVCYNISRREVIYVLSIQDDYDFSNYIIVGVSSGPDSMCLLNLLEEKTDKIVVCHINHNVRIESKEEEEFLKNYCQDHHLIFESMTITNYTSSNFENEARQKRYSFYEKILHKYHSKYLFLAHHGDDLIETVLMKIVRGSNLEGYAGIKEINNHKDYKIIRPLLPYTKEEILNYNKKHNIPYFIDISNTNTDYTRNRYRLNILPLLKKEDKNVHQKFLRYSQILQEYDAYIKSLVQKDIDQIFKNNIIYLKEFNKLDSFLQKNSLYYILNELYDNKENNISERHISNIIQMIQSNKPNQRIHLPNNIILIKEYDKVYIKNTIDKKTNYNIIFEDNLKVNNFQFKIIKASSTDGNEICRLNSQSINLPLHIRNRKDGDYIILKGKNCKKKVKEIFIESKIPLAKRDIYPILVDNNDNILWIPNIKKSIFCIKKDEKDKNYDIIIKCNEREENL